MSNRATSTVLGVGCIIALGWASAGASAEVCRSGFLRGAVFPVESNAGTSALGDLDRGQVFRNDGRCVDRQAGDANADGKLDLSDPVAVLSHLFLGGGLACPGAAEVSGDATLDLSDPIYLLGYLFLGGPPPVGPSLRPCG